MKLNLLNEENLKKTIEGCQINKSSAQEVLYNFYAAKVFGICLRYSSNREEAEDMLQEGFVKLFKNITKYDFTGSFPAWMSRVITNNCIDMIRRKPNLYTISEEQAYYLETDTVSALDGMYEDDLVALIQELPIGYKTVFNMYVIEGYSHKEIADILEINEGTSKSQLNRAKKLLQKKIVELNKIEFQRKQNY